jgi:hypothetical protein
MRFIAAMAAKLNRAIFSLKRFLRRLPAPDVRPPPAPPPLLLTGPPQPLLLAAPVPAAATKVPARVRQTTDGDAGMFRLKHTLLDKLDYYFRLMRRMKKADHDAFDLFSQIGAAVCPDDHEERYAELRDGLSPWFLKTLPTFGAVAWGLTKAYDPIRYEGSSGIWYSPRLSYFHKYKRPPSEIELTNHQVYLMTMYFDENDWHHGCPVQFAIAIQPDGSLQLLRTRLSVSQQIRHRTGRISHVQHQRWGTHRILLDWAGSHDTGPAQYFKSMFVTQANRWTMSQASMIRIAVKKDKLAATFAIDANRTPYFFSDREPVYSDTGSKLRIFHAVRVHQRQGAPVRMHFRGLRRFTWNGYTVNITVPGRDHANIAEFDVGAHDSEWFDGLTNDWGTSRKIGAFLAHVVEHGPKDEFQWQDT